MVIRIHRRRMAVFVAVLVGITAAVFAYANMWTRLTAQTATKLASLSHAPLRSVDGKTPQFSAEILWADSGAVVMAVRRPG